VPSSAGAPVPFIESYSVWNSSLGRYTEDLDLDVLQCKNGKAQEYTKLCFSRSQNPETPIQSEEGQPSSYPPPILSAHVAHPFFAPSALDLADLLPLPTNSVCQLGQKGLHYLEC